MPNKTKSTKHWLVLLLCCGLSVTSIGLTINTGGVFFTPVSESLGVLRGTFSFHSTINLMGTAIVSLFVPRLMQAFRYKALLLVGVLATALTTFLMAFAQSVLLFYLLAAIRGVAVGLYGMVPLTMIVNEWFDKHHGLATGMVLGSSGIAGAIFSPVFTNLIESYGWEFAYMALAATMIIFCLPSLVYPFAPSPREEGLLPYGYKEPSKAETKRQQLEMSTGRFSLMAVILFSVFSLLSSGITGLPHHFPGFAESMQYSSAVGAGMLSAGMIANITSKLAMGFLSDRIGPYKATFTMIVINVFATSILLLGGGVLTMIVGAFLFGSIFSIATVGKTLLTKEYFGLHNYGKAYPIISFAGTIGGALGMSLVGYVYDFTGSYRYAFLLGFVFQAVNVVLLVYFVRQAKNQIHSAEVREEKG